MKIEYTHPKKYEGVKPDTPSNQKITMARVEKYCLKCDQFMGKEHDFSECQTNDKWENGKIVKKKTCPFSHVAVSLIEPEVNCKIENDMYKCIKGFCLEICDDDGFTIDGEYTSVEKGSLWVLPEDENYRLIGGEVRLESNEFGWLEISKETLEENFELIQDKRIS